MPLEDWSWFSDALLGRELLFDLTIVPIEEPRIVREINRVVTQAPRSTLAFRPDRIWKGALEELRSAVRERVGDSTTPKELSRDGSAALIDVLTDDEMEVGELEVPPNFWGPSLERFAFGGILTRAIESWGLQMIDPAFGEEGAGQANAWCRTLYGMRLERPYAFLPVRGDLAEENAQRIMSGFDRGTIVELLNGDEYSTNLYEHQLTKLGELLLSEPFCLGPMAIVPRIASPVGSCYVEALTFGEKFLRGQDFLAALKSGDADALHEAGGHLSDAFVWLLTEFAVAREEGGSATASAVAAQLTQEPLRSRIEQGRTHEVARESWPTEVIRHYKDAENEFLLLAIDDLGEEEESDV